MTRQHVLQIILIQAIFTFLLPVVLAAPLYVSPTGDDAQDGATILTAVATISRAVQLATNGDSILLLTGTYLFDTTQTVNKAVLIGPYTSGDQPILIPRNLGSGSLISITGVASPNEVTLQNLLIDLSAKPSAGLTAVSSTSSIISINAVSIICNTSVVDSCVPFSISDGQPKFRNVSATGGSESTFTSLAAGSFIRDSFFSKTASSNCGSLKILTTSDQFLVEGTTISDSVAFQGGGMCVLQSNVLVRNLLCTRNLVSTSGGCIWVTQTTSSVLTVENSEFSYNSGRDNSGVTNRGGAIGVVDAVSCTISGSRFYYNGGVYSGGAVGIGGTVASATITNSSFVSNSAAAFGGAFATFDTPVTISTSVFDGSFVLALAPSGTFGSHVGKLGAGTLSVTDSTFRNGYFLPSAGNFNFGGVLCYLCTATITRCRFENNIAPIGAGYHALQSPSSIIDASVFRNNTAQYGAGIMLESSTALAVRNSLFEENTPVFFDVTTASLVGGGGLLSFQSDTVDVRNCTFRRNECRRGNSRGCAFHTVGLNTIITVTDSLFEGNGVLNAPNTAGSALSVEQSVDGRSSLILTKSTFRGNFMSNAPASLIADFSVGTVMLYVPSGAQAPNALLEGTVTDCFFFNNSAVIGAGVATQDANATIRDSSFVSNYATVSTGGVYALTVYTSLAITATTLDIANTTFQNNTALKHPIVDLGYRVSDLYLISMRPDLRRPHLILGGGISWSKAPSDWILDASISFGGSDATFLQPPAGQQMLLPRIFFHGYSTLDLTRSDVYVEGCLLWWSVEPYLKNVPTLVLLGQHNLYCNDTLLRNYEIRGQAAGKVYLNKVTE
eukprot:TRINITY_DN3612_c0_g1_i1.p1 TRINITY_DN3612_c0_g1~~TRINITY_DN3612_c0_g1_i1.p1  ORF type:complete len:841 (-),score=96.58 TRINITY_DN3612_c0_g1_i1:120-2642(-)